jgi:diguanylate cyclase (GGDEF)-like protein
MSGSALFQRSVVIAVTGMFVLAGTIFFGIDMTVKHAVAVDAERKARSWSSYFIDTMPALDDLISSGSPDESQIRVISAAEKIGDVFRFKLFDKNGDMTLVSDELAYSAEGASNREHSAKAAEVLRSGVSNISLNDGTGKPNRPPLYVEAYVPVLDQTGSARGVVEVYVDQTSTAALFKNIFAILAVAISAIAALTFGLPMLAYLMRSRQALEARRRVEYLAHYEPMTGLLNRASFTERLEGILQHRRSEEALSVVFLDIDDFKSINDRYGHEAGDELLKHVARCISAICGEDDITARTGGDEFTLALTGRDTAESVDLVEQLMHAVGEPILVRGQAITGRLSCGIYVVETHVRSMSEVMLHADVALYQAKLDGKNNYRLFSPELERSMRERKALEHLVVETAAAGGFELHYQPLLHAQSGQCAGFEALLRLPDGRGGFVPPGTFIPILESTGLIGAVGKWVIEEATRSAATWPEHLFIAVNLSVKQFHHGELVDQIKHALAASGLRPERLELEVTESMLMENSSSIEQQFRDLRALGVSIAMDDFGTGYSSLGYLWKFGFDKLKIDRSFISALSHDDARAREILDTIIMLGHKLDMSVTAEGIETKHQAEVLTSLSCDQFQGYLYGKPGPLSQIAPFLLRELHDHLDANAAMQDDVAADVVRSPRYERVPLAG